MPLSTEELIEKFKSYYKAIRAYKNADGKKAGFTIDLIQSRLFPGYQKFLNKLYGDLLIKSEGKEGEYNNESLIYKDLYDLESTVKTLEAHFTFYQTEKGLKLDHDSVKKFLGESTKPGDDGAPQGGSNPIVLLASIFVDKFFEVKPRGIFEIFLENKIANFTFYKENNTGALEVFQRFESGGVDVQGGFVYLTFPAKNPKKMYVLYKSDTSWDRIVYIIGTYLGDTEPFPVAGKLFCEKVDSLENGKQKLNELIPNEMQYELFNSFLRVTKVPFSGLSDLENATYYTTLKKIKEKYKGIYRGYYLSRLSNEGGKILIATLRVTESGKVFFYSNPNDPTMAHEGILYIGGSGNRDELFFRFAPHSKLKIFRFFMNLKPSHQQLYIGSYGGGFQDNITPETGRVIFCKVSSQDHPGNEQVDSVLLQDAEAVATFRKNHLDNHTPSIASDVFNFLRGESVGHMHDDIADAPFQIFRGSEYDLSPQSSSKPGEIPDAKYAGHYQGFIVHSSLSTDVNLQHRLQELSFEVMPNGTVVAKSAKNQYIGFLRRRSDQLLTLSILDTSNKELFWHVLKEHEEPNQKMVLKGTYSGVDHPGGNRPVGGRILLYKVDEPIASKDYDLHNLEDCLNLQKNFPRLLPYFTGLEDTMIEGQRTFSEAGIIPKIETRFDQRETIRDSISGMYKVFRLRNRRKSISIVPMAIYEDGTVLMKSIKKNPNGKDILYRGKAMLTEQDILSIFFYSRNGVETYSFATFNKSVDSVLADDDRYLIGFFTSWMPHDRRAFSTRMAICAEDSNCSNLDKATSHEIFLPKWGEEAPEDFETWNRQHYNLLKFLAPEENNMIYATRGPQVFNQHDDRQFEKKFDYGKVFFMAAVQAFRDRNRKEAEKLWEHAKAQGFSDLTYYNGLLADPDLDGASDFFK